MIRQSRLTWVFILAVSASVPQAPADESIGEQESAIIGLMHDRLDNLTDIRSNLVMVDVDGARVPARALAERENDPAVAKQVEPYVEALSKLATQVLEAESIESAARSVSMLAANCGYCHMENRVGLQFGYDQLPADLADTQTHMQRHQWAMDRMWEGVIGPSAGAWKRGTAMLSGEPLHADYIVGIRDPEQAAAANELAGRVHELGRLGSEAATPAARSEIYSEMIFLCASCHQRLGVGQGS
jgi:cytochrome c553